MLVLQRLYHRLDALTEQVLPERVRFWFKGVCLNVARRLVPGRLGTTAGMPSLLPAWAYAAVREAATDEPKLSPELVVPYMRRVTVPVGSSQIARGYGRLWDQIDQTARHVFILGDADGGVSDLLLKAMERLAAQPASRVVVVWTAVSGAGLERLPNQLQAINLTKVTGIHNVVEQAIILGRSLIEIKPKIIHVASSTVGWTMFRTIAEALSASSALYAELPSIMSCREASEPHAAEQSVASGLSKSIRLIVNSRQTVEDWLFRHGVDAASINVLARYDFDEIADQQSVNHVGQTVRQECPAGCLKQ